MIRYEELTKVLRMMGYRKMSHKSADNKINEAWGKPVGYCLFIAEITKTGIEWGNYFKSGDGQMLLWETKTIDWENNDLFMGRLKLTEAYTKIETPHLSNFEFLSREEVFEEII